MTPGCCSTSYRRLMSRLSSGPAAEFQRFSKSRPLHDRAESARRTSIMDPVSPSHPLELSGASSERVTEGRSSKQRGMGLRCEQGDRS